MIIHMVFLSACVKLLRQLFSWRLRALFQSRRPTLRGERAETGNPLAHHAEIHDRCPVPNGPTTVSVTWLLPKAPRESVMPRVFCQMLISVISIRYTVFPSKNKVILWYYLYFSKYIPLCRRIPTLESGPFCCCTVQDWTPTAGLQAKSQVLPKASWTLLSQSYADVTYGVLLCSSCTLLTTWWQYLRVYSCILQTPGLPTGLDFSVALQIALTCLTPQHSAFSHLHSSDRSTPMGP